jgi:hypothetical protein
MSQFPAAYVAIIDPLIDAARAVLERGERLVPVAFVGNLSTGETHQVVIDPACEQSKDNWGHLLRQLAEIHQADFMLVIMDAWGLPKDKVHRYQEIIGRCGSISASPYRIDVVSFALETRHGLWAAQVPVKPKNVSKKKRTFDDPDFRLHTDTKGRFVDLLPVKEAEGQPAGGLH